MQIAVAIPCYNEQATIAAVVKEFAKSLPHARVVVFDNASTDQTASIARSAGAEVIIEPRRGKGHVVRRMFVEIDTDILIMVDGDGTYDASAAPRLVQAMCAARADMVIATRANVHVDAGRQGHAAGNRLFNYLYQWLFGREFTDIFSGYRAFSRRFIKSFPATSAGFEIETEMAAHASALRLPVVEIELSYGRRPADSPSKLSTFRDGFKIARMFVHQFRHLKPHAFYGLWAAAFALFAVTLALPLILTFLETGLVPRLPTAVLVMGLMVIATMLTACGLILESVAAGRMEQRRLAYLQAPNIFEVPIDSREGAQFPARESPVTDWVEIRQSLRV